MNGGLLIDKPAGWTSHDVVARVRRLLATRAVGHTGTLDPFATGLLVVVIGSATRLARFVEGQEKEYRGTAVLGTATDTDDASGRTIAERDPVAAWPDLPQVRAALATLVGRYDQRPPAYSAKKVGGTRSYRLARQGRDPALVPTPVEVRELNLLSYAPPRLSFRAVVGPGTYIRALARDLGERLGIGAHLEALRRTRLGRFRVEDATPAEALTGAEPTLSPADLVSHLLPIPIAEPQLLAIRHGRAISGWTGEIGPAALLHEGELVAVAVPKGDCWQPAVVLYG